MYDNREIYCVEITEDKNGEIVVGLGPMSEKKAEDVEIWLLGSLKHEGYSINTVMCEGYDVVSDNGMFPRRESAMQAVEDLKLEAWRDVRHDVRQCLRDDIWGRWHRLCRKMKRT